MRPCVTFWNVVELSSHPSVKTHTDDASLIWRCAILGTENFAGFLRSDFPAGLRICLSLSVYPSHGQGDVGTVKTSHICRPWPKSPPPNPQPPTPNAAYLPWLSALTVLVNVRIAAAPLTQKVVTKEIETAPKCPRHV